jgi:hypothetical protein
MLSQGSAKKNQLVESLMGNPCIQKICKFASSKCPTPHALCALANPLPQLPMPPMGRETINI